MPRKSNAISDRDREDFARYESEMKALGWGRHDVVDESWCWYWWHDEDPDCDPVPTIVMQSTNHKEGFFASAGQHGWTVGRMVSDMGGWWMKMKAPEVRKHPLT